jgi:DNA-binding transcriptional ArsR family regulator
MSSPARQMKDSVYAQLARIGKALAAPKRIELLDLLAQGPRTVEALAVEAALSVANASQHLRHLHGLRENLAQFSLLVVVNAFVGAMVGMERTILAADRRAGVSPRGARRRCSRSSWCSA